MTEAFETACFGIITYVGTARSCFVNAVQCAKQGDFEAAQEQIRQGDEAFTEGHHIHADLLAQDANGELNESGLILMHAEDQLMSAETFRIILIIEFGCTAEEKRWRIYLTLLCIFRVLWHGINCTKESCSTK